jgi:hypothetical protein
MTRALALAVRIAFGVGVWWATLVAFVANPQSEVEPCLSRLCPANLLPSPQDRALHGIELAVQADLTHP